MKYNKEEKAISLDDWQKSGKGAWAYATENRLIPQTFCSWTKKATETKKILWKFIQKQKHKRQFLLKRKM